MSLALASSSGWVLSQAFAAFVAMVGGIFVIIGLAMEKTADKKWFRSQDDLESSRRRENRGWWILMVGILIEVLVAGGEALKHGIESRSMRQAQEKIDLGKQPVFSASAFITFSTIGTNVIKAETLAHRGMGSPVSGSLALTRRSEPFDNIATILLSAETFSQFGNEITMELRWDPVVRTIVGTNRNETCEELIGDLNRGIFTAMLFKQALAVSNANLTLVLNGTVRKQFELGKYIGGPESFPGVMFSVIEATNNAVANQ